MLGHSLIARKQDPADNMGQILGVTRGSDGLILQGILLRPHKFKDYVFTNTSIERMFWKEPVELFDSNEQDRQLIGAGQLKKETDGSLSFTLTLLHDSYKEDLLNMVTRMGYSSFDRMYPIMPILRVKKEHMICTICDNPFGMHGCEHKVGKDYLRSNCKARVLEAKIEGLMWSGVIPSIRTA